MTMVLKSIIVYCESDNFYVAREFVIADDGTIDHHIFATATSLDELRKSKPTEKFIMPRSPYSLPGIIETWR